MDKVEVAYERARKIAREMASEVVNSDPDDSTVITNSDLLEALAEAVFLGLTDGE